MDEHIKALLIKYITGNADEDEQLRARQWMRESEDHLDYFMSLKAAWQDALHHPGEQVINTDQAFSRLQTRLQIQPAEQPDARRSARHFAWPRTLKIAAAAAIVVTAGGMGLRLLLKDRPQPVQQTAFEIFVPRGKMKKLLLPDSSEVWLNAGTRFGYAAGYGERQRDVFLEGEAWFSVKHNDKIPFTVKTHGYSIRDIGTVFTVSAYANAKNFETAVIDGRVEVTGHLTANNKTGKVLLVKNEVLKIAQNNPLQEKAAPTVPLAGHAIKDTAAIEVQAVVNTAPDMESYSGWKDHLLVFNEETFSDVAQRLERTYDVKLVISSKQLASFRYTGRFNKVQRIADALAIIKETTPITYRREKDVIIISMNKK